MTQLFVFPSDLVCVSVQLRMPQAAHGETWQTFDSKYHGYRKQEGRDTLLISVFAKDYQNKDNRKYDIYHLLKTQIKLLTDFNSRRSDTIGDLRMYMYVYTLKCWLI